MTIKAGDSVTFKNNAGFPHNIVFDGDAVPEGVNADAISHEDYLNVSRERDGGGRGSCAWGSSWFAAVSCGRGVSSCELAAHPQTPLTQPACRPPARRTPSS